MTCGEWFVFGEHSSTRKPTDQEYLEIGTNPGMRATREAWVKIRSRKK